MMSLPTSHHWTLPNVPCGRCCYPCVSDGETEAQPGEVAGSDHIVREWQVKPHTQSPGPEPVFLAVRYHHILTGAESGASLCYTTWSAFRVGAGSSPLDRCAYFYPLASPPVQWIIPWKKRSLGASNGEELDESWQHFLHPEANGSDWHEDLSVGRENVTVDELMSWSSTHFGGLAMSLALARINRRGSSQNGETPTPLPLVA